MMGKRRQVLAACRQSTSPSDSSKAYLSLTFDVWKQSLPLRLRAHRTLMSDAAIMTERLNVVLYIASRKSFCQMTTCKIGESWRYLTSVATFTPRQNFISETCLASAGSPFFKREPGFVSLFHPGPSTSLQERLAMPCTHG